MEKTLLKLRTTISNLRDNLSLAVITLQIDVSAQSLKRLDDINRRITADHSQMIRSISEIRLGQQESKTELVRQAQEAQHQASNQERVAVLDWLSGLTPSTFTDRHNDSISRRKKGTGGWILETDQFKAWLDGKAPTLWCPGMPGAGKSISMYVLLKMRWTNSMPLVAHLNGLTIRHWTLTGQSTQKQFVTPEKQAASGMNSNTP